MKYFLLILYSFLSYFSCYSQAPTNPSSNPIFNENQKEGSYLTFSVTNGNGTRRLVVAKKGSPVTAIPQNGISYLASDQFGQGFELATGEFIVYANTGASITVRNLEPSTDYHFAVFEYNLVSGIPAYLVSSFLATSTRSASPPATQASQLVFSNVSGNRVRLSWTNGSGRGRMVVAREGAPVNSIPTDLISYSASSTFGSGTEIGTGQYVVYKSNTSFVDVSNLRTGSTYYFAIFEYNGNSQPVFLSPTTAIGSITTADRPTSPATNLQVTSTDGNRMRLTWTIGSGRERILVARKNEPVAGLPQDLVSYTANTQFGQGMELLPGEFVLYKGTGNQTDVLNLEANSNYHYALFEYDLNQAGQPQYLTATYPVVVGTTVAVPSVQASNLTVNTVTANSIQLSWANGNGSRRLLIGRLGAPITVFPEEYRTYSSSTTYGNGALIQTDNYVLYWSNGSTATITGLQQGGEYHFALFESNGLNGPVYQTNNPARASAATSSRPTIPASNLTFTSIEGNSMRISFNRGDGAGRIILARTGSAVTAQPADGVIYSANQNFGQGDEIAPGQFVLYSGSANSVDIQNLLPANNYYFSVFEYSGSGSNRQYLLSSFLSGNRSTVGSPTVSTSNLQVSAETNNAISLQWTNGNGSRRVMVIKAGSPVDAVPVDLIYYSSSNNPATGTDLGNGNYVVYNGSSTNITINGLSSGTLYHFAVFESNGNLAPVYKLTDPAVVSGATSGRPTIPSSNLQFTQVEPNSVQLSWNSGNGNRRMVVAKENTEVTFLPTDAVSYLHNAIFGQGDEVVSNEFIVYDGTSNSVQVEGLEPGKSYHFAVFEYTGTGATIAYLTSTFGTGNFQTLPRPEQPAQNILFSNISASSATVNWTSGNGARSLVVVRANEPVGFVPVDYTTYLVSSVYGQRAVSPDQFGVFQGAGNAVSITGLEEGVQYYVSVFELNGTSAPVYLTTAAPSASFTTTGAPAIPASNPAWSVLSNSSIRLHWTNGNGQRRVVIGKQDIPVNAFPVNGQTYLGNPAFGSGPSLGNGNFILYAGTENEVVLTNLDGTKDYHFQIIEYNQFGSTNTLYQTNSTASLLLPANSILPVTWVDFTGRIEMGQVQLQWKTSLEVSNSHFEVEWSANGHHYQRAGIVNAGRQGNGLNSYNWTGPIAQPTTWYRIKQVDEDGKFSYSSVLMIRSKEEKSIRILQNPVRQLLRIWVAELYLGASLQLVNVSGVVVYSGKINSQSLQIPRYSWVPGIYYLTVSTSTGRQVSMPVLFE
ncbi:fibronectin type III domain-containing protein [Flavihumibacter sp. UBA7668]|uniref:fibronectin type III domain-containing protein n=1 Tax=Flavihumibacter sp. UBA7668 TaxID=1946542 RepID=UPI0025C601BF|nr:hypothetical protein [Flavihumibacter sp. UBA7668]